MLYVVNTLGIRRGAIQTEIDNHHHGTVLRELSVRHVETRNRTCGILHNQVQEFLREI